MKEYPSIPHGLIKSIDFYVFAKYDGSQIRAEWNAKSGFHKFGTRHRLLDPHESPLGEAQQLIITKYGESIRKIFAKNGIRDATLYFAGLTNLYFAMNVVFFVPRRAP